MTKLCRSCGRTLGDYARFCDKCGLVQPLQPAPQIQYQYPQPPQPVAVSPARPTPTGMPVPEVVPQQPPRPEAEAVAVPSPPAVKESKWVLISMAVESQMLEELRKIREAVTPKPAPPPPKGFRAEFKDFLGKAGVLGLAIGFIMGLYIGKVVSALVGDIIMPIPGAFIPGGDWRKAVVSIPVGNGINFAVGDFVGVIVDFLIVAAVVFLIAKYAGKMGLK